VLWPHLRTTLDGIGPAAGSDEKPLRTERQLLEEILSTVRSLVPPIVSPPREFVARDTRAADYDSIRARGKLADQAVEAWLRRDFPSSRITAVDKGPYDIRVDHPTGSILGVEVKVWSERSFVPSILMRRTESAYRLHYEISRGRLTDFVFCIVGGDIAVGQEIAALFKRKQGREPKVPIVIGVVNEANEFAPVARLDIA
jgi:hypothetical protein